MDPYCQNKVPSYKAIPGSVQENIIDGEDPYPSLSDLHDHEPNLEFDDSELLPTTATPAAPDNVSFPMDYLESPVSDGTIEENFEEELARAPQVYQQVWKELGAGSEVEKISEGSLEQEDFEETFAQLNDQGLVQVVGEDDVGRRIIIIYACRLPNNKEVQPEKLLRYLMFTLDKYVEQDYSVVYFHYGISSRNKPPLSWLWKAYKAFDRKYKKNLKALYLVHPTNLIRVVWQMLKPMISAKFGRKMMYVNYLHELRQHLNLDQISIPQSILDHDSELILKNTKVQPNDPSTSSAYKPLYEGKPKEVELLPTHQFGVSLQFIKEHNTDIVDSIPPIVRQCVEFLLQPDALECEGIFRRSTNITVIRELQSRCNRGEIITFNADPHVPAVLLKTFLRDLEEPLMTFELYDEIIKFQTWSKEDRPRKVKILILERLPMDNYKILKFIVQFLWKVMDRCDMNKMTCSNLAVVFGPNLVWPQSGQMSLQAIAPINTFTDFLLQNQETIFII